MRKALVALLFCMVPGSAGYPLATDISVTATPVLIDPDDPARRQFGQLRYLAGWHLDSREHDFGGYSALMIDGDHFLALSDIGKYLRFRMAVPGRIDDERIGELPAYPSYSGRRADRDAESMTVGPGGDIWVGFENRNAILRYARDFTQLMSIAWPAAMKDWSTNSGPEAMVRLGGGRFLLFAEGAAIGAGVHAALSFPGDPTNPKHAPFQFGYRPPKGYAPTDAAELPDGRVVILHRRFGLLNGFAAALTIVEPADIRPGAIVVGELVAELEPPLSIDNMEGISVVREGNRTILWMISDDNQVPIERTLLLKWELVDRPRK